jgi:hypothetical protein
LWRLLRLLRLLRMRQATAEYKELWRVMSCDCFYAASWTTSCLHGLPPAVHNSTTPEGIWAAVQASRRPIVRCSRAADLPLPLALFPPRDNSADARAQG